MTTHAILERNVQTVRSRRSGCGIAALASMGGARDPRRREAP